MYKKVPTDLNFVAREEEVLSFWQTANVFQKAQKAGEGKPDYTFYDGPPTANGKPHIGHVLTRCIKDLFPRFRAMSGYNVLRKAGWDTHGLPVELEVEKELGLDGKEQIEAYGVEKFIEKCKESVWKYKGEWEELSERVGFWADMEHPYITYENDYIESVWWSIKEIHEKGLLYKGHKVVPYCPRCGTALSSHEVAQGYEEVTETSATVLFDVEELGASLLVWTTTPWTLPSNVAACVNPSVTYVKAEKDGKAYILTEALLHEVLGEEATIMERYQGSELAGIHYTPLFPYATAFFEGADGNKIIADNYVTTSEGTGIVHIAPAFGEDDARIGGEYKLPFVQLVDAAGQLQGGTPWDGLFVKDADPLILESLKTEGKLFDAYEFTHTYPFCWRCHTPLIYYARSSWFIEMTALRDLLLENNNSVNWLPENIKAGRMGNFLENVIDWGVSRERYWGTPLPVWMCDCGHMHVVGSIAELKEMGQNVPADIELHKPYIDEVKLNCPVCGGAMTRESDVLDCWYDSGAMPFAQWHYPFENKEMFDRHFPANFISEAVDQTRGWFYTLLAIGTAVFGTAPFENCIVLGHVQDKDGRKMSKHIGNVVDPWDALNLQGADAVRWYFYSNSAPWIPNRFSPEAVMEAQRKFMGTLWNTYAFYILYAEIDGFDPTAHTLSDTPNVMDRWVLSRLHSVVKNVSAQLEEYHIIEATRELSGFVDDLSNWYVRRNRERFWGAEMNRDKIDAYMTLYTVLETFIRLIAPFTPFLSESIYQNLVRSVDKTAPESIHLCAFPVAEQARIDKALEDNMAFVLRIVALGRAGRNSANIKNRQPVMKLYVGGVASLPEMYGEIIKGELNVKQIEMGAAAEEYITYNIKPQLKTLGPRYGKLLPAIRNHLEEADGSMIVGVVRAGKPYTFTIDATEVVLEEEDMLIEPMQKEGYAVETEGDLAVIIDTHITPELAEEGNVREIISKIQTMRKDAGFEVTDHIKLYVAENDALTAIVERNEAEIAGEVLADEVTYHHIEGYEMEWDINGITGKFGVVQVK